MTLSVASDDSLGLVGLLELEGENAARQATRYDRPSTDRPMPLSLQNPRMLLRSARAAATAATAAAEPSPKSHRAPHFGVFPIVRCALSVPYVCVQCRSRNESKSSRSSYGRRMTRIMFALLLSDV
jgi:hypothetical protein